MRARAGLRMELDCECWFVQKIKAFYGPVIGVDVSDFEFSPQNIVCHL